MPVSVDVHVHFSICLLQLLSPLNLGDATKTPRICLVGNQPYIRFSVSMAESKTPETELRKAVPAKQTGKRLVTSGEQMKSLERQWAWPVL